jgi:hypothetical protein
MMMMMMMMGATTRGGEMSNVMLFGSGFPVMQWHIPEECNRKIYVIYVLTSKSASLKL